VDLAWFFIEHGGDVTAQDEDGLTPLHRASLNGFVDLAPLLVEHGTDVTTQATPQIQQPTTT
jgi:ankyrin repeat protein